MDHGFPEDEAGAALSHWKTTREIVFHLLVTAILFTAASIVAIANRMSTYQTNA
jgi:hypothetical protein